MKTCTICHTEHDDSNFYISYRSPKGKIIYRGECKKCHMKKTHTWGKNNPHKRSMYEAKNRYGITEDEYKKLYKAQNGKCAICETPESELKRRLHIDHDHKTGKIRGLLCFLCNAGMGKFKDDPVLLKKAQEYLCD